MAEGKRERQQGEASGGQGRLIVRRPAALSQMGRGGAGEGQVMEAGMVRERREMAQETAERKTR